MGESCLLQIAKRSEHKPRCRCWRWKWGRNNQFSDTSKCALNDAYLNRPDTVRRERKVWKRWMRRKGKEEGHREKRESRLMRRNWTRRKWRWNCYEAATLVRLSIKRHLVLWGVGSKWSSRRCRLSEGDGCWWRSGVIVARDYPKDLWVLVPSPQFIYGSF